MADAAPSLLRPDWAVAPRVRAAFSTRAGGVGIAPYDTFNLGAGAGDDPAAVGENRRRWADAIGARPVWLSQVHGARVLRIDAASASASLPPADASWTTEPGVACTVLVADCLPVLFALRDGRAVAAAHAGWRGLAAGVLEATLAALVDGCGATPADVVAWLGPCIGPRAFEVGADVLHAFDADPADPGPAFVYRPRADGSPRWLADLPALARRRLRDAGVAPIAGAAECTVERADRYFSYRRDGLCGRMAAAVWIAADGDPPAPQPEAR